MPNRLDEGLYKSAPGTLHYNVRFISGATATRVTERVLREIKSDQIEWIWMVEARRYATREEIEWLCRGIQPPSP
jgi:hypothetical protein